MREAIILPIPRRQMAKGPLLDKATTRTPVGSDVEAEQSSITFNAVLLVVSVGYPTGTLSRLRQLTKEMRWQHNAITSTTC